MKKERAQTSVLWKLKSCMRKGLCKKIVLFLLHWYIWKEKSTTNKTLKSHLFRSEIQTVAVKDLLNSINSALHGNPYWKVWGICIKIWWEMTWSDLFFYCTPPKLCNSLSQPCFFHITDPGLVGWSHFCIVHIFPFGFHPMQSCASSSVLLPAACSESIKKTKTKQHSTQFCAKAKALALLDFHQHLHKANGIGTPFIPLPLKYLAAQSRHISKIKGSIILFLFKSLLLISHV